MNIFPGKNYKSYNEYAKNYFKELNKVQNKINLKSITKVSEMLSDCFDRQKRVFVCGNGGSASISNHLVCDSLKGISQNTSIKPKIISLSTNIELITAISNDINYSDIFVFQLMRLASPNDCLITISSSGNSKNIINAIKWGKKNNINTISLNGFDGGKASKISDISINVPSTNYGIVEDSHQSIMHILSQFTRFKNLDKHVNFKKINF